MDTPLLMWGVFFAVVLVTMVIDLGLLKREREPLTVKQALVRSVAFFLLAMAFNAFVFHERGAEAGSEFLMGYLIELSLSVDNLFVFLLIFTHFGVPRQYQHRVLLWGILGAILMRGLMIWLGDTLIERFTWIMYLFGGFLVLTGMKMLFAADAEPDVGNNVLIRFMRSRFRITEGFREEHFFVVENGHRFITPLFMVLVLIEISDLIFAVDSIPAIFAITDDGYIIFTSNIFAILGLRSLYFALAAFIHRFEYLKFGLSLILIFIGIKMLINHYFHRAIISTEVSLAVVVTVLAMSVIISLAKTRRHPHHHHRGWIPGSAPKDSQKAE
jgi:tellurite resistance protein TerC